MQTEPSVPLILVLVEELASTARKTNSDDATVFEELARQANCNKEKLDTPSFCLSVLGGKATDVVGKALSKGSGNTSVSHDEPIFTATTSLLGFWAGEFCTTNVPVWGCNGIWWI